MTHRHLERRLFQHSFGAGIQEGCELAGVFHPAGDQSPAHERQFAVVVGPDAHDGHWLRRRNIIACGILVSARGSEIGSHRLMRRGQAVS